VQSWFQSLWLSNGYSIVDGIEYSDLSCFNLFLIFLKIKIFGTSVLLTLRFNNVIIKFISSYSL